MKGSRWRLEPLVIVIAALALRLYRIADYTTFQGDQGIDALAAKRLLVDHIIPLEGPATSAGGVHLGPLYYYLLALPMTVAWLDPLADAVLMAILGALSAGLVYVVATAWFGRPAGLTAGVLMAISPAAIVASRSAWNPTPAPFFVLLAVYGLARSGRWLILSGAALGCIIQFHYFSLGLILVVLAAEGWLVARGKSQIGWLIVGLVLAAATLLPLIVHELQTGYPNLSAAAELIHSSPGPGQADSLPRRLYAVLVPSLVAPFLAEDIEPLAIAVTPVLLIGLIAATFIPRLRFGSLFVTATLVAMLAQAALYPGPIFPHYLIAYSPSVFLALGAAVALVPRWSPLVVVLLAIISLTHLPYGEPERQLRRSEDIARHIATAAGAEPFAIWLIAQEDSAGAYHFQLERIARPAVGPGAPPPTRLFVICQSGPCTDAQVHDAIGADWSNVDYTTLSSNRNTIDGLDVIDLAS